MSTPFLDKAYVQVDFDRELVFKFFTVFSLFEYALKATGFYTIGSRNDAQPDWAGFANVIEKDFDPNASRELLFAVNYILRRPVKRQIVRNNSLVFVRRAKPKGMTDIEWLSVLIRGVRNNLFHGGKFRYARPRDPELIENSLTILECWSHCDTDVERVLDQI